MNDKHRQLADIVTRQYCRSYNDGGIDRYVLKYQGEKFIGNSPQQIRSRLAEFMRNAN